MPLSTISSRQKDILAFFEETFGDLYLFLLYSTLNPAATQELAVDLYASFFRERRTLWWRSDLLTPEALFRAARKAVRSASRWRMQTTDLSSVDELFHAVSFVDVFRAKQVRTLHESLFNLSHEDREIAVTGMLLGWPVEQCSAFFEEEYADAEQRLERLKGVLLPSSAQQGLKVLQAGQRFHPLCEDLRRVFLPEGLQENVRRLLMDRVEHGATVALNTVALACAWILLPLGIFGAAAMILQRPPLQNDLREIAALETLLAGEVRTYDRSVAQLEEALRGMGASLAYEDMRSLTLELASLAVREHAENQEEIEKLMENLRWSAPEREEIAGALASFVVYMSHAYEEPPMR